MTNRSLPTSVRNKLYGRRWRELRARFLKANPLCVHCLEHGRYTPARDVDHVIPHKGDPVAFWSGQLQALCHECHGRKTARDDGGFGNKPSKEREPVGCDEHGNPISPSHHWNVTK